MVVILLANLASTLFMTGLIWFVQVVHYPLFAQVGRDGYPTYQESHQRLTTFVVFPPMFVELLTSLALLASPIDRVPRWMPWAGAALVGVIWLSTALLQVPRHNQLGAGFDAPAHQALVATNWIRTVAWTARAALMLWIVSRQVRT